MRKLKVLVAESQTVVKQQLTKELEKDLEIAVVGATDNGKDAFEMFKREEPNIVIFDLLLPIYLSLIHIYSGKEGRCSGNNRSRRFIYWGSKPFYC